MKHSLQKKLSKSSKISHIFSLSLFHIHIHILKTNGLELLFSTPAALRGTDIRSWPLHDRSEAGEPPRLRLKPKESLTLRESMN